jgi:CO dehydrogenase maturation factor
MKVAVSGKGGVGKTTLSALLAVSFAREGRRVIAIDADPDANLAQTLGLPDSIPVTPLIKMKDLIAERTESQPGTWGKLFKINPTVSDIPDKYSYDVNGVKLLVLGTIYKGGGGCACPENVFLKNLMAHLVLQRDEVVIVDMEAGIEHLGRATVEGMDALIVVVEPGQRSLSTAHRVRELAADIGLRRVLAVANKVRSRDDEQFIRDHLDGLPLLGSIAFDARLIGADMEVKCPLDGNPELEAQIAVIRDQLAKAVKATA